MKSNEHLTCPKCQNTEFEVKKEATYVYTYELDHSIPHHTSLPFLFDKRDMLSSNEYIECKACHRQYCYDFTNNMITGELT